MITSPPRIFGRDTRRGAPRLSKDINPGAQTLFRGDARPVRTLLSGVASSAVFVPAERFTLRREPDRPTRFASLQDDDESSLQQLKLDSNALGGQPLVRKHGSPFPPGHRRDRSKRAHGELEARPSLPQRGLRPGCQISQGKLKGGGLGKTRPSLK